SRLWSGQVRFAPLALEMLLALVGIVVTLWATGIFMVGSVASFGFGQFRMNLLGPINPAFFQMIVPGHPVNGFEWEGVNYVGLGIFVLAAIALATLKPKRLGGLAGPRFLPLVLAAFGMALFALSNRVAFGPWELFAIPLPAALDRFFTIFRSSGRFFWPMGYLIIF